MFLLPWRFFWLFLCSWWRGWGFVGVFFWLVGLVFVCVVWLFVLWCGPFFSPLLLWFVLGWVFDFPSELDLDSLY